MSENQFDRQTAERLADYAPLGGLLDDLRRTDAVKALLGLPEPMFNAALELLRRAHLEGKGYRFQDPAACESCEG